MGLPDPLLIRVAQFVPFWCPIDALLLPTQTTSRLDTNGRGVVVPFVPNWCPTDAELLPNLATPTAARSLLPSWRLVGVQRVPGLCPADAKFGNFTMFVDTPGVARKVSGHSPRRAIR